MLFFVLPCMHTSFIHFSFFFCTFCVFEPAQNTKADNNWIFFYGISTLCDITKVSLELPSFSVGRAQLDEREWGGADSVNV